MKKIMVVAGGDWQVALVKKAKEMGHYVICSNLYKDSPAFQYADACEVANVLDKETNLRIAQKYQPDAVISDQSDIAVPTVAYVNEALGLNGIGYKRACLFTNKYLLRNFCKENQIAIPDFKKCRYPEDAWELLDQYGTIIIKPLDSQSSRGVFTVRCREELLEHYQESIAYSNTEKAFLAEEYLEGDEFTIDGLVVNGQHFPLCISIKEMYTACPNISKVQVYTTHHSKYDYDLLRSINRKLIMATELPFGLTHSEYKFSKGKFYLIEAGARGGGSNLSAKIVPFMSGVDTYDYLIKSALGEKISSAELEQITLPENRCVIMRFFDFGTGIVKEIKGKKELEKSQFLIDYQLEIKEGDELKQPEYGRLRPGHFIIGANSFQELKEEADRITDTVKVIFS